MKRANSLQVKSGMTTKGVSVPKGKTTAVIGSTAKPKTNCGSVTVLPTSTTFIKPSSKLNIMTSSPFAGSGSTKPGPKQTPFQVFYHSKKIPFIINHGSINNTLTPTVPNPQPFPLLLHLFDGLTESVHPFNFIATRASIHLLSNPNNRNQIIQNLPFLVEKLRKAIGESDPTIIRGVLDVLEMLSNATGEALDGSLKFLLGGIGRFVTKKELRSRALSVLETLEKNGGPGVLAQIKVKIPTYVSCNGA